ncbi:MAG TPA: hypothetical protein O0X39_08335 [Methanocorpusculum sp.]|nr:hypothetical protein [Methanocorpusculum sp.]
MTHKIDAAKEILDERYRYVETCADEKHDLITIVGENGTDGVISIISDNYDCTGLAIMHVIIRNPPQKIKEQLYSFTEMINDHIPPDRFVIFNDEQDDAIVYMSDVPVPEDAKTDAVRELLKPKWEASFALSTAIKGYTDRIIKGEQPSEMFSEWQKKTQTACEALT